MFKDDKVCSK